MGINIDPKCKQCRRLGEKLMLKGERCNTPKCAMVKRNYPPGFHGSKGRKRQSDYGLQLAEKQKAKKQYHILEKQFSLIFNQAEKQAGDTGENLLRLLEMRLDNVVYRLGLANSRIQARQFVSHGHFLVNGRKVNIPSYTVKVGEVIKVKEKAKKFKFYQEVKEKFSRLGGLSVPGWLYLESQELGGKVVHLPALDDIQTNINTAVVVEFYSR